MKKVYEVVYNDNSVELFIALDVNDCISFVTSHKIDEIVRIQFVPYPLCNA